MTCPGLAALNLGVCYPPPISHYKSRKFPESPTLSRKGIAEATAAVFPAGSPGFILLGPVARHCHCAPLQAASPLVDGTFRSSGQTLGESLIVLGTTPGAEGAGNGDVRGAEASCAKVAGT